MPERPPQPLLCRLVSVASVLHCLWLIGCGAPAGKAHSAVAVRAATVRIQDVPRIVEAPGTVAPLQTVNVYPQVAGTVTHVAFAEGADLVAGQLLLEVDPAPYRAALARAQALLAHDQEEEAQAAREAGRIAGLPQPSAIAAEELEQKRSVVVALDATVASDRAAVALARLDVTRCKVLAPISGRAGQLAIHTGDLLRAGGDAPLVVIHQIHPIAVAFHVPQAALPDLLAGRELPAFATPTGGVAQEGRVSFVDNQVDAATGTVLVKATYPNADDHLWPGQFVAVRLVLRTDAARVVVPDAAVSTGQDGAYVYVVGDDGAAVQRPVVTEGQSDGLAVIGSGLVAGEVVVTDGQLRLSAGAKVEVMRPSEEGTR